MHMTTKYKNDPLARLLSPEVITHAEGTSMPYLGYHLLRHSLCEQLLGESEAPILHWLGKELGAGMQIESAAGLIHPFIRLGLGKLELIEERGQRYLYRLTHPMFIYIAKERLISALSYECGILAGAIATWRAQETSVEMELHQHTAEKLVEARIMVTLVN